MWPAGRPRRPHDTPQGAQRYGPVPATGCPPSKPPPHSNTHSPTPRTRATSWTRPPPAPAPSHASPQPLSAPSRCVWAHGVTNCPHMRPSRALVTPVRRTAPSSKSRGSSSGAGGGVPRGFPDRRPPSAPSDRRPRPITLPQPAEPHPHCHRTGRPAPTGDQKRVHKCHQRARRDAPNWFHLRPEEGFAHSARDSGDFTGTQPQSHRPPKAPTGGGRKLPTNSTRLHTDVPRRRVRVGHVLCSHHVPRGTPGKRATWCGVSRWETGPRTALATPPKCDTSTAKKTTTAASSAGHAPARDVSRNAWYFQHPGPETCIPAVYKDTLIASPKRTQTTANTQDTPHHNGSYIARRKARHTEVINHIAHNTHDTLLRPTQHDMQQVTQQHP